MIPFVPAGPFYPAGGPLLVQHIRPTEVSGSAILPWFFAGALFPIGALPGVLTAFAKVLPLTHAMALMRYGLVDSSGSGLHDIWGMGNTTAEAFLSLGVVALFAVALGAVAIRAFTRSAVC